MKRIICILIIALSTINLFAQTRLNYVVDGLQRDVNTWVMEQSPRIQANKIRRDSAMAATARECHNIRLTLYSCDNMGFFDLTYELHRAISLYKRLDEMAQPDKEVIMLAQRDMTRMQYLLETLRRMPPELEEIKEVSDSISSLESDTLMHTLMLNTPHAGGEKFYMLSPAEQALRDSCVVMARCCIREQENSINMLLEEAANFARLRDEFRSTYDYANNRFDELSYDIYTDHREINLAHLLTRPLYVIRNTITDCYEKYASSDIYALSEFIVVLCEMFGMLFLAIIIVALIKRCTRQYKHSLIRIHRNTHIVANALYMVLLLLCLLVDVNAFHLPLISLNAQTFLVYFIYVLTLQLSLLLRCAGKRAAAGIRLYAPSILCGFALAFMRMYFVPDSLLGIIMIPLTWCCWLWQMGALLRFWSQCDTLDSSIAAITAIILLGTAICSSIGHSILALQIIFWWESQQAAIVVIAAVYFIMQNYGDTRIKHRTIQYLEQRSGHAEDGQTAIQITWLYDMVKMVGLPILCIISVPLCIYMSLNFVNAQEDFIYTYKSTFFSLGALDHVICDFSIEKLAWVLSLYFGFNFLRYVSICIYRQTSEHIERKRSGHGEILTNQLNLTLGTNLINLVVWGLYITVVSIILKIPMTALTVIIGAFTGGIGFAMKDVMNNVIYGTQLMAGRLRVGDYIICDNYRGAVTSISYQTTQIVTEEGAMVSFTNADLFRKNFQNLTRHNPYEVCRVTIGVAYDSDLDKVERLIREAIEPLNQKDKFGRMLLSPQEGLRIEMRDLQDSEIVMAVRFAIIAERRTWFLPVARKAIFQNLVRNGIEIPYPQLDIHQK